MSSASERANGRASGPVLTSLSCSFPTTVRRFIQASLNSFHSRLPPPTLRPLSSTQRRHGSSTFVRRSLNHSVSLVHLLRRVRRATVLRRIHHRNDISVKYSLSTRYPPRHFPPVAEGDGNARMIFDEYKKNVSARVAYYLHCLQEIIQLHFSAAFSPPPTKLHLADFITRSTVHSGSKQPRIRT